MHFRARKNTIERLMLLCHFASQPFINDLLDFNSIQLNVLVQSDDIF